MARITEEEGSSNGSADNLAGETAAELQLWLAEELKKSPKKGEGAAADALPMPGAAEAEQACHVPPMVSDPLAKNVMSKTPSSLEVREAPPAPVISDGEQASTDSNSSFFSRDRSGRSPEYVQATQLQQQPVTSFSQRSEQPSVVPPVQESCDPTQHSTRILRAQAYYCSSSIKSISSIYTSRLTPFRSMLPRELLLENNLRVLDPRLPFPILPADAASASAGATRTSAKWRGSGFLRK